MPLHSYFVLAGFALILAVYLVQTVRLNLSGSRLIGKPPIRKIYFYTGKIAAFTSWMLFILKAISPELGYINIPPFFSWTGTILLYAGLAVLTVGTFNLGNSLSVGLPGKKNQLQTRGLYRFSRNPVYLGVHIIAVGSCVYFPDLLNLTLTTYSMVMHHRIIRMEERYLWEQFGTDWLVYSARVKRYI
jgi:protein-S-isoprenylcysteine O-methyltransferase Ste14